MLRKLTVSRSEPLPIHAQLAAQIRYQIDDGAWGPGSRLPTVRQLAAELEVNYNTVRAVYGELEREGYLVTEQGRGTFVAAEPPSGPPDRSDLLDLVDESLARARAAGCPPDEFARLAAARARLLGAGGDAAVALLFAECNRPDLQFYARSIEAGCGVEPQAVLLERLRERSASWFRKFDLLATTLEHAPELQKVSGGAPVLGLMVEPSYSAVIEPIALLPESSTVGLICGTEALARGMKDELSALGVRHLRFSIAGADSPEDVERLFRRSDRIFVSRLGLTVRRNWPEGKEVRPYLTNLSQASLRMLRKEIARIRSAKAEPEADR